MTTSTTIRKISEINLIQFGIDEPTISFFKKEGILNNPMWAYQRMEHDPDVLGLPFLRSICNIVFDDKDNVISWETPNCKWVNVYYSGTNKVKKRISLYMKDEQICDVSVTTYTKNGNLDTMYSGSEFIKF